MHDPYGLQHFYLARMEEGRRISKQKNPQPEAMVDMMANVLVRPAHHGSNIHSWPWGPVPCLQGGS